MKLSSLHDVDMIVRATTLIKDAVEKHTNLLCSISKNPTEEGIALLEENTRKTKLAIATNAIGVKAPFTMPVLPEVQQILIENKKLNCHLLMLHIFSKFNKYAKEDINQQLIYLTTEVMPNIIKSAQLTRVERAFYELRLKHDKIDDADTALWARTWADKINWISAQDEEEECKEEPHDNEKFASFVKSAFMTLPLRQMYPLLNAAIEDVSESSLFIVYHHFIPASL